MVDGVGSCTWLCRRYAPTFYLDLELSRFPVPFFPLLGPQLGVTPRASAGRDTGPENLETSHKNTANKEREPCRRF